MYNQEIKVQPLTQIEIDMINEDNFVTEKKKSLQILINKGV